MNWEAYRKEIESKGNLPEDWYILGIDLGTTNSVISYWDNANRTPVPVDISNGFGKIPLPSVVQYRNSDDGSEWIVGEEAYRSIKLYPQATIRSIKRKMGTNEPILLDGKNFLPEEISALILKELVRHIYSLNPKAEIAGLVVSVPYDFDDAAKKATMRAVRLAELSDKLICLIEEPKAAALTYNFRRELDLDERILVFDFGGGTLDITLFHVTEKTESSLRLQVISEGGEASHGGDNIDDMLAEFCYRTITAKTGLAVTDIAPENQAEIAVRAREAKERLSGVKTFRIPFTFCVPPFVEQFTRDDFDELINNFISKTRRLTIKTLREAYNGAIAPDEVNRVLLEGGSSLMPWVKNMLVEIFNDESKIYRSERPHLDISFGATYYAAMKMGLSQSRDMQTDKLNVDFMVTIPHDIGIEIGDAQKSFFPMIRRGTPYEFAKKSQIFTLSGNEPKDMTEFYLKILERIDKEHKIDECRLIGEVEVNGLPQRPSGKTRLNITLLAEEEGGIVRGSVEDVGFGEEYPPSGFTQMFTPERFTKTEISRR
ncbi:MAG: Hsp70 family protein [Defluviitaleaceae bacterium]|nr:Hsp70 family protein [Defluviitaleaceae bacterium]